MEVVGAIASVGAILGGAHKALAIIWSIPGIPDDWRRLKDEITSVRAILAAAAIQFPPTEIFQPHTVPVQSALESLKDIANELQALLNRVTTEKNDQSSNTKTYKPSKIKWVYLDKFKKEIAPFLVRLQNAKMSLNLALTIAHRYENLAKAEAMIQTLQNIEHNFAIMTIQTQALPNPVQQVQQVLQALQHETHNISQDQIQDVSASPAKSAGVVDALKVSESASEVRPLRSSCARFCFCRCHNSGWFSRARCDYSKCRRVALTRQTTWNVDLGRWLSDYGVSISISASLRPNAKISISDIRYHISWTGTEGDRVLTRHHFHGVHPMDMYENSRSVLEDALYSGNIILLEVLISLWEVYFQQYGLNRLEFFQAQSLLLSGVFSEKETTVLSKLISYGEVDHSCEPTALHRAVERGDMDGAVKALASDPTLVSMYNVEGDAPIHIAVRQETISIPMITLLKDAGAELDQRCGKDATPLMLASSSGDLEVVQWFLRQGSRVVDPKLHDALGQTALHKAVESDKGASVDIMERLIEAGAHSSARDDFGCTPPHLLKFCRGAYAMCASKVGLLTSAGAKIDAGDTDGGTALMISLVWDNSGAVSALLDAGASLKHRDKFGQTVFHYAARYSGEYSLSEFCRRGTFCFTDADPFLRDSVGDTAWDEFILRLVTPYSALTSLGLATTSVCHLFERLYVQSRNFTIRGQIAALKEVITLLNTKNVETALAQLALLVQQKEPRSLWRTGVEMHPLRSIYLQLRDGDVLGALDALQEQVILAKEQMGKTPWQYESEWWHEPYFEEFTSREASERQFAFACRMRQERIERWRRWRIRKGKGKCAYTLETIPPNSRLMLMSMLVRAKSRGRRTRRKLTKPRTARRKLSDSDDAPTTKVADARDRYRKSSG